MLITLVFSCPFCHDSSFAGAQTVKDLSKCLANPCFVTNCGEGLDYRAMAAIFSGLVQSGAWGCFDECVGA